MDICVDSNFRFSWREKSKQKVTEQSEFFEIENHNLS